MGSKIDSSFLVYLSLNHIDRFINVKLSLHYWYKLYFVSKLVHVFSCKQQNQLMLSQAGEQFVESNQRRNIWEVRRIGLHDPEESLTLFQRTGPVKIHCRAQCGNFYHLSWSADTSLAPSSLCLDGASIAQQMDFEQSLLLHTSCFQVKVWSFGTR